MTVYRYVADSNRFACFEIRVKDRKTFASLCRCEPVAATWVTPVAKLDASTKRKPGDFPSVYTFAPVLSDRAVAAVEPLFDGGVELLPIKSPGGGFRVLNVTRVVDGLGPGSEVIRFDNGVPMRVAKYVFNDRVKGHHIFRLPESAGLEVLVSREFKDRVEAANLKGAMFVPLGDG